ncbi:hypothetical protein GH714_017745 [Hevea brasiliensis]|uniref:Uncharacterized protein n=1 Tax=Hevea brasiliensis TaxID=3981 RepID=A0A6A6K5F7_HEVBR|nr:hypothetical protein GH714_017745 [Hevea brasiliensis]
MYHSFTFNENLHNFPGQMVRLVADNRQPTLYNYPLLSILTSWSCFDYAGKNAAAYFPPSNTATHPTEPVKNSVALKKTPPPPPIVAPPDIGKWNLESWPAEKVLQLPEYPMIISVNRVFPRSVWAGEVRILEDKSLLPSCSNAQLS